MSDAPDYKEYWKNDNLKNVVAGGLNTNPEGFDVIEFMQELLQPVLWPQASVLDFGCGHGRLCKMVPPGQYFGIDINPQAVELARRNNPGYTFEEIEVQQAYPQVDICVAYTVFLHLDDDTLRGVLWRLYEACECIAVAEILGREWRRPGDPPVFNRDLNDYLALFREIGFALTYTKRRIYERYLQYADTRNIWLNGLVFERI